MAKNDKGASKRRGVSSFCDYLQKQHEADPLVISVLFPLGVGIRLGVVDAGERHLRALPLPVGRGDGVGAVYPAVRVEDVLGQVLAVYAVDGVADVLAGGDDQGERDEYDDRETVVQSEDGAVGVNVRDFNEALETAKYVQHLGTERHRGRERDRAALAPASDGGGGDSSGRRRRRDPCASFLASSSTSSV